MTTHGNVGSRYDADFQPPVRVSKGFEEAWFYALNTSIYGVCPSPSGVKYLFQHGYCSRWQYPRLWKREVSGIISNHLYAHGSALWSLPDADTPLLGPVSWARISFLSAIQLALVGNVSPWWRLDCSCLDRAVTILPFHKFCAEIIWRRISETQISDVIFFLISLHVLVFVLYYRRKFFPGSTPTISMGTVLSKFRHSLEPPLGHSKRRIRWTCKCGQRLYDDLQEIRPEAAAQLEYELNRRYNNVGSKSSNGGQGSRGDCERNRQENPASSNVTSWWSPSSWGSAQSSSLRFLGRQNVPGDDVETAMKEPQTESIFLLLCIPHLRWASKLVHMDVHKLRSDQSFFEELGSHYRSMRGLWTSWFSLKQLTRIQFVQFELHKNELVDIRKLNDLPPETSDDYRYRPVPPEVIPPIGENLLMHLYDHPEDADDDGFCLDRVPKKLRERLTCSQRIGWGVNFSEGLNVKRVCVLGLIGLFTSAAFGIAWSIKRNDVQGGFGVAALY
ncbi:hypothetical protein N7G274_006683 [Stereocaulon virgatum]|uniref:Uncharacterized protein n=1 Tax=Stereocaulon virgatum TaxID=373712 RepID=A0ABR4A5E2_9LECA